MNAIVTRLSGPPKIGADWDTPPWHDAPAHLIHNYMGERPEHFPKTEVKIAYEDLAVYVMFRVQDRYVRATAADNQESVCGDSCVEFFFTPGSDLSKGYFNIEMNCGGTILFHFNSSVRRGIEIPKRDCDKIAKSHSMPRIVDPEIQEPVTWTVAYSIPIVLLKKYCQVATPKPHTLWRANFYKCADHTSHPHWLTWSPVDYPKPNFHLPESFGVLDFD